jgi:outer membrane immunogenic protein
MRDGAENSMHRIVHAVTLAAFALVSGAALATEIPPFAAPDPTLGATPWQGFYAGVSLGYQHGFVGNSPARPSGVEGGIQGGHNWQRNQFVFGVEADLQASDANDTFAAWKFSNPWFGTLRGRAGFAVNNVLLYGTLGLAYGTLRAHSALSGVRESKVEVGWVGGGGIEIALMSNWTARAEYLYVDLGAQPYALTGLSHGIDASFVRLGVNYRF